MSRTSSLARLQQFTTVATLAAALAVAAVLPPGPLKFLGAVATGCWWAWILALEFVLLYRVGRRDPAPRPRGRDLVRAWWAEVSQVPRVFFWRQPFFWDAVPDHLPPARGRRGVVFIHGLVCNRGFWTPWLQRLREKDVPFLAINLEPVFTDIGNYAPLVEDAVRRMTAATGQPPVLVCHSMGGLAARAWLVSGDNASRVRHVVTIGSPHHGTWLARLSHLPNGRQMREMSSWIRELGDQEAGRPQPPFTCWYSNCDNIVFPPSTACLGHARNRLLAGAAHVDLAFRDEVFSETLALLSRG